MGTGFRAAWRGVALAAALAAGGGTAAAEESKPAPFEYVRDASDFAQVARLLASREGFDAVLVVLDSISFAPPPGSHEFSVGHNYGADFVEWTKALGSASAKRPLYAATSRSAKPVRVGDANWSAALYSDLGEKWWEERKPPLFESAARWMPRLLAQVPGKKKLIALVGGIFTPETWTSWDTTTAENRWRRALAPVGAYWDEEAVGEAVAAKGAVLWIVAPEARFGDALPVEELPQAPWACRPALPWKIPDLPSANHVAPDMPKEDLEKLAKTLREQGLSEPEVQRLIANLGSGSTLDSPDYGETGRFACEMPNIQRPFQLDGLFNTACPSGYGWWPYARAAAKTGGSYVLYPPVASNWSDTCPRDPTLLEQLAPELVAESDFVKLRASDGALAAMLAAQREVIASTPWEIRFGFAKPPSWCGFDTPGHRAKGARSRQVPQDDAWSFHADDGSNDRVVKAGRSIAAAAAKYDDAIAILDKALLDLAAGNLAGTTRRSQANLRLAKLWFEMSAFHLESLANACAGVAKVRPAGSKLELAMSRTDSVRLSDCLDAWDKRVVPAAVEERYGSTWGAADPKAPFDPEMQSSFLNVDTGHPFFRAKREKDRVLARLDPRLRPRAERVIAAAALVMKHDARSPWGWVTYYSGLETFSLHTYEPVKPDPHPYTPPEPGTKPPPPPPQGPSTPTSGGGGDSTPK